MFLTVTISVHAGVTRGVLEKAQDQLNKCAGMACKMCGSAGWWQLEMLLAQIAQQAELRSQPELVRLMKVRLFVLCVGACVLLCWPRSHSKQS